jgi:mono/diheme cytochrome c family protein
MRRFLLWTLALVLMVVLGLAIFVRGRGVSARRTPSAIETRVARAAWRFLIPSATRSATNPVPATPETIRDGLEHWADHCAICHASNGSGETTVGQGLYPRAPDMRADRTQRLTDGELFYAIEQGIPLTGMPAWSNGTAEGERDSWALVRFIRHLPAMTPAEIAEVDRLTPRPPVNDAREKEIQDFLSGGKIIK